MVANGVQCMVPGVPTGPPGRATEENHATATRRVLVRNGLSHPQEGLGTLSGTQRKAFRQRNSPATAGFVDQLTLSSTYQYVQTKQGAG
jgi:hypothetical protein